MPNNALHQKIIFVTGKGGVGKSSVAASLAFHHSKIGKKVLLVELGHRSYFQYVLRKSVSFAPREIASSLWICLWDGQKCLKDYLIHLLKIESIVNLFFENKVMRALIQAAPALNEISILGKLTSHMRGIGPELDFDLIIVDGYATGHFKSLLNAPKGLSQVIQFGPMGEQARDIRQILSDPEKVEYYIVSLPEELPVNESIELFHSIKEITGLDSKMACNRILEIPLSRDELETIKEKAINGFSDDDQKSILDFTRYIELVEKRQKESIQKIKDLPIGQIYLPASLKSKSQDVIEDMTERLGEIWG